LKKTNIAIIADLDTLQRTGTFPPNRRYCGGSRPLSNT